MQLFLWYIPYVVVSFISLLCIVAIIVFLLYYYNKSKSSKLMVLVMDMLLLTPFLVVFCCVCIIEVTIEILLQQHSQQHSLHINNYSMWLVYAVVTPISGAIIPIAFFFYFLRKKRLNAPHKLQDISRARATVHDSDRVSANSHTSQQERPNYLTRSGEESDTSQDSIPHSLGTNYGSIDKT